MSWLLEIIGWVDQATSSPQLLRLAHGYIRLFVFSYLELTHTCCDINRVQHDGSPDHGRVPYPQYSPNELRRITRQEAHLTARLEELVHQLISKYDSLDGKRIEFLHPHLIPTLRKALNELKEENRALYAVVRRELGFVMYEDEDKAKEDDDGTEEESDVEEESDEGD